VIILVTDGGETTSHADLKRRGGGAAREVLLYTILIRVMKSENGRNTAASTLCRPLRRLRRRDVFSGIAAGVADNFDRIDAELRTQYRLAYTRIREGLRIRIERLR